MDYEIIPNIGAGRLSFGLSPDEVRLVLQSEVEEVEKSSSGIPVDFFPLLGIFAYYKQPGVLEAVEFGGPASPTFKGRTLLEQPYSEMETWFRVQDPDLILNDAGFRSERLGIGLYAPAARREPRDPVKGVIVFEPGFYERHSMTAR
jgi:hypothetical protein